MEHQAAISGVLIPILLALISFEGAIICWHIKAFIDRNRKEHERLQATQEAIQESMAQHGLRLTVIETKHDHLENDFYNFRETG